MKIVEFDYNRAQKDYPNETKEIIKKLRSGKSKHKNIDLNKIIFSWEYSLTIESISFQDLFKPRVIEKKRLFKRGYLSAKEFSLTKRTD